MDDNYRAFGAVGRRKTPPHMLNILSHLTMFLCQNGWTMRSGAGDGADRTMETACDAVSGKKEIYLPWRGFNNHKSGYDPVAMPFSDEETQLAESCHPAWDRCSPSARALHKRNGRIVLGHQDIHGPIVTPIKFLLCWTEFGVKDGGTGHTIRICDRMSIPVINLGLAGYNAELERLVNNVGEFNDKYK